jgi:proline racemase
MFYAIVDATRLGFAVTPDEARDLAILGEKIRLAARQQLAVIHPENPAISGVSIVQLNRPFEGVGKATRNTCIVAPGRSDRSPTGTGTSARLAVLYARGLMKVGDEMIHESIIGSKFRGRILGETRVGVVPAILPAIEGRAFLTGFMQYLLDPADPWPEGYRVADTWGVTGGLAMTQAEDPAAE